MKGKALIYRPHETAPTVRELDAAPDLAFLKEAVGGWIEQVPMFSTIIVGDDAEPVRCVVFCNEEGKLQNLPVNTEATVLWDRALRRIRQDGKPLYTRGLTNRDGSLSDVLCGTIIVLTGDSAFMEAL